MTLHHGRMMNTFLTLVVQLFLLHVVKPFLACKPANHNNLPSIETRLSIRTFLGKGHLLKAITRLFLLRRYLLRHKEATPQHQGIIRNSRLHQLSHHRNLNRSGTSHKDCSLTHRRNNNIPRAQVTAHNIHVIPM